VLEREFPLVHDGKAVSARPRYSVIPVTTGGYTECRPRNATAASRAADAEAVATVFGQTG